jgi:hypothetical protein
MQIHNKIVSLSLLLLSVFLCIESSRLGLGNFREPGSGFLPFGASLVIGILSVILFLKERGNKDKPIFRGKKIRNTTYILSVIFIYPFLLYRLGYFICTLFLILFCSRIVSSQKWRIALLVSICTAISSYLLFVVWLGVQIPKGTWVNHMLLLIKGFYGNN